MTEEPTPKRRLLFVDDEPNILSGLRRMLRGLRHEWEMSFVETGEQALELLAANKCDAVISDMRMPGMDGAELCAHIQRLYPGTVRIILSGHSELESAMRCASLAHQFLSKPCDADSLKAVVSRSFHLRSRLENPRLKDVVGQLESLPAIPHLYSQLVSKLADAEADLIEVADIVSQDAAITAKLLQLVNSSFFGIARKVTTMRDAISYLGLSTIKTLVLSYEMFKAYERSEAAEGFDIEHEQAHSLTVAAVAQELLEDKTQREWAFLCGVLHDVGKLVLNESCTEAYEQVLRLHRGSQSLELSVLERRVLKVTHGDVGGYLLGIWGLPHPIVEAVYSHDRPEEIPADAGFDVVPAVYVANSLVHEVERGSDVAPIDIDFLRRFGLESRIAEWRELARVIVDERLNRVA